MPHKLVGNWLLVGVLGLSLSAGTALADDTFDWVTIGDVGNPGIQNVWGIDDFKPTVGDVDYEYRIARTEISTADWLEFVNTFAGVDDAPSFTFGVRWGARQIPFSQSYELDPFIEQAADVPVVGMTWRQAAHYVNWLNNDKAPELDAIMHGAYDAATFGFDPENGEFTDQLRHDPDAKYWIPTYDELLKATHWDPNKNGEGEGGWWQYNNGSDVAPVPGLPGEGETSAGVELPLNGALQIPLGSYPEVTTPWGLLDASGGASEWTEGHLDRLDRYFDGAPAGDSGLELLDNWLYPGSTGPGSHLGGLRLASNVPSASGGAVYLWCATLFGFHRRRKRP